MNGDGLRPRGLRRRHGPALYAGGDFTTAGGVSAERIAKWNGASWSALGAPGSGMNDAVYALAVFDDGSRPALYAGGAFTTAGGVRRLDIAKWDGTSWSALGTPGSGMNGAVYALSVFDDGSGRRSTRAALHHGRRRRRRAYIAKWNGTSWSALGARATG